MLSAPYGDAPYTAQPEYGGANDFVNGAGASAVVDVTITLGTNDSKNFNWAPSGKPKNDQQFLSDYRSLVDHSSSLATKPRVFLALPAATGNTPCCSIDGTVIHDEVLPLIKQVAAEKGLPTIDINTPTTGHPDYFIDGVHPTDAGYALIAQWMHDGLLADAGQAGTVGIAGSGGVPSANAGGGGVSGTAGAAKTAGFGNGGTGPSEAGASNVAGSSSSAAGATSAAGSRRVESLIPAAARYLEQDSRRECSLFWRLLGSAGSRCAAVASVARGGPESGLPRRASSAADSFVPTPSKTACLG